jgi:hypothetical protein
MREGGSRDIRTLLTVTVVMAVRDLIVQPDGNIVVRLDVLRVRVPRRPRAEVLLEGPLVFGVDELLRDGLPLDRGADVANPADDDLFVGVGKGIDAGHHRGVAVARSDRPSGMVNSPSRRGSCGGRCFGGLCALLALGRGLQFAIEEAWWSRGRAEDVCAVVQGRDDRQVMRDVQDATGERDPFRAMLPLESADLFANLFDRDVVAKLRDWLRKAIQCSIHKRRVLCE